MDFSHILGIYNSKTKYCKVYPYETAVKRFLLIANSSA